MTPKRLVTIRKKLKLTQSELAELLGGYGLRTVQSWEWGEQKIPPAVCELLPRILREREEQCKDVAND